MLPRIAGYSRSGSELAEKAFHFLSQCIGIAGRGSSNFSEVLFELGVEQKFQVGPREQTVSLAAEEEVPQLNCSLQEFRNS